MAFKPELLPKIVERLAALADETRIRLLMRLRQGEANVSTLMTDLGVAQASVSKHLGVLKQAGLVEVRRQGVQAFYRIRDESIFAMCDLLCDGVHRCLEQDHRAFGLAAPAGTPERITKSAKVRRYQ